MAGAPDKLNIDYCEFDKESALNGDLRDLVNDKPKYGGYYLLLKSFIMNQDHCFLDLSTKKKVRRCLSLLMLKEEAFFKFIYHICDQDFYTDLAKKNGNIITIPDVTNSYVKVMKRRIRDHAKYNLILTDEQQHLKELIIQSAYVRLDKSALFPGAALCVSSRLHVENAKNEFIPPILALPISGKTVLSTQIIGLSTQIIGLSTQINGENNNLERKDQLSTQINGCSTQNKYKYKQEYKDKYEYKDKDKYEEQKQKEYKKTETETETGQELDLEIPVSASVEPLSSSPVSSVPSDPFFDSEDNMRMVSICATFGVTTSQVKNYVGRGLKKLDVYAAEDATKLKENSTGCKNRDKYFHGILTSKIKGVPA